MKKYLSIILAALTFICITPIKAQVLDTILFKMSLEELMNLKVTSVSKKAEKLQNLPFALYVITAKDIEKSAGASLNELLREYVPGFWSASVDYRLSDSYIRNTNNGSVLVLLDGTPMQDLMSSTFSFSNFDIPLSEIERIEVIRGSGGTVYGANSATGVISIFTKKADDNSVEASVKVASPAYTNISLSGSKKLGEKFSIRTYGQYNYFGGYPQRDDFESSNPTVTSSATGNDTIINNRFSDADRKVQYVSFGINPNWMVSDKLTISSNIHFNMAIAKSYYQYFPIENSILKLHPSFGALPYALDTVFLKDDNRSRLVGNLKFDYRFSDKHSLFVRASTNWENQNQLLAGGYQFKNYIIDLEVQDNIEFPYNTISIGGNLRSVNYNLFNFYDTKAINYIDPKNSENLKGIFIQDKISLLNNKLNFYLGIKAENFSLINSKFYFSPMVKVAINPIDKLTLWGGYTQSYTTPGYIQTNIELRIFRISSVDFFSTVVPSQVYLATYQQAVAGGADAATARAMAQAYMASPDGQAAIGNAINQGLTTYPNEYSFAAINGPETEPTSMASYEAGIRYQPFDKLYFESNFYHTTFEDGVLNSPTRSVHIASPTVPGEFIDAYYYGNYAKGTNIGLETVIKIFPIKGLEVELSHSLYKYTIEYQENNDFDIAILTPAQKDLVKVDYPPVPKNIFRANLTYELPWNMQISLSGLYASEFYNRFGTTDALYAADYQRFDPLYGGDKDRPYKDMVGKQDSRLIVNFRIDKYLMNDKMNLYIWGNDISSTHFVESVSQLIAVYPRQVGRMIGVGLDYKF